jgi:DNA-binding CsgD family transcriptional regulator
MLYQIHLNTSVIDIPQQIKKMNFCNEIKKFHFDYAGDRVVLSRKEISCLALEYEGFTRKEAGKILNLSPRTIETHLCNIKSKFNCENLNKIRRSIEPHLIKLFPDI